MNVILLICDTVRPDYLGCYGNSWVQTPNIDRLASRGTVFDHFYCGSFPTGPMRKDVHSGRFTFTYAGWTDPRPNGETLLSELLNAAGYRTAYIGDTDNSRQYLQGFEHCEIVSHEPSGMANVPDVVPLPADERKLRFPMAYAQQVARWSCGWRGEDDRRAPRTMMAAHRWLEKVEADDDKRPFFLWIDTFDPHEPWDPPQYYVDLYDRGYTGDRLIEPAYETSAYAGEREVQHMRCRYAAKLTMVDRWIGYLLDGLELMGLADETAILFASDHGFYHGEHKFIGKVCLNRNNGITGRWPLYKTIAHAPLVIAAPGRRPGRASAGFCQPPDITATILDLCQVPVPDRMHGQSLLPDLSSSENGLREMAVSSSTYVQDAEVRSPTSVRTDRWLYVYGGDEWASEFYDLRADPLELHNLIDERPEEALQMHALYLRFLESVGCPTAWLEQRRHFRPTVRCSLPPQRII